MKKTFVETPLSEIRLRRYEKPHNLGKRELIRKLCLSIGVLNPGDSRDVIVDVLLVLLEASAVKESLTSEEIRKRVIIFRKDNNLTNQGTAHSNIIRQIRRLRQMFIVDKKTNYYQIFEFMSLEELFVEKIDKLILRNVTERVQQYFVAVDNVFMQPINKDK